MFRNKRKSTTTTNKPPKRTPQHQESKAEVENTANISEEENVGDLATQRVKLVNEEKTKILRESTNEVYFLFYSNFRKSLLIS